MKSGACVDPIVTFGQLDRFAARFEVGSRTDDMVDPCIPRALKDLVKVRLEILKEDMGVRISEHTGCDYARISCNRSTTYSTSVTFNEGCSGSRRSVPATRSVTGSL